MDTANRFSSVLNDIALRAFQDTSTVHRLAVLVATALDGIDPS